MKMRAGDVFFGSDYADHLRDHLEDLPDEAREGTYALGTMIMVSRNSMAADYRLADLSEWFPARVCLPPPVSGQWYRWYDPFVWFETDGPIHHETDSAPMNTNCVGKLWGPGYYRDSAEQWAYPIEEWKRLIGGVS